MSLDLRTAHVRVDTVDQLSDAFLTSRTVLATILLKPISTQLNPFSLGIAFDDGLFCLVLGRRSLSAFVALAMFSTGSVNAG